MQPSPSRQVYCAFLRDVKRILIEENFQIDSRSSIENINHAPPYYKLFVTDKQMYTKVFERLESLQKRLPILPNDSRKSFNLIELKIDITPANTFLKNYAGLNLSQISLTNPLKQIIMNGTNDNLNSEISSNHQIAPSNSAETTNNTSTSNSQQPTNNSSEMNTDNKLSGNGNPGAGSAAEQTHTEQLEAARTSFLNLYKACGATSKHFVSITTAAATGLIKINHTELVFADHGEELLKKIGVITEERKVKNNVMSKTVNFKADKDQDYMLLFTDELKDFFTQESMPNPSAQSTAQTPSNAQGSATGTNATQIAGQPVSSSQNTGQPADNQSPTSTVQPEATNNTDETTPIKKSIVDGLLSFYDYLSEDERATFLSRIDLPEPPAPDESGIRADERKQTIIYMRTKFSEKYKASDKEDPFEFTSGNVSIKSVPIEEIFPIEE